MNSATLLWSVLFGAIGLGFFVYARKQRAIVPLICGIGLMLLPYFIGGYVLIGTGVVLCALPFVIRY